jgi:hypothetical protein
MIQESLDGVAYAFRGETKLHVWAKEDVVANFFCQDIGRRSVYLFLVKNTNKCLQSRHKLTKCV